MVHNGTPAMLAFGLLMSALLAGCAGSGGEDPVDQLTEDAPELEVTSTTGGIRGVVVDEAVRPIKDAEVVVESTAKTAKSDADGLFVVDGLAAGTYVVKASHPLYDLVQQTVEVVAGVADPPAVKLQLTRIVFENPYVQTLKFDGFIVCSANLVVVLSEECGEGVGVPCEVPPPVGCQRQGGQGNNNAQFDFTVAAGIKTVVIEQVWTATSEAGSAFYSPISTEWSCLPVCSGNVMTEMEGESPLYAVLDNETLEDNEIVPDTTVISVFTWASRESTGALLNQQYQVFATGFYYLPAPEGWSFVRGDANPF
jgi:hypothetical protein